MVRQGWIDTAERRRDEDRDRQTERDNTNSLGVKVSAAIDGWVNKEVLAL
jgi:hypothetical protein